VARALLSASTIAVNKVGIVTCYPHVADARFTRKNSLLAAIMHNVMGFHTCVERTRTLASGSSRTHRQAIFLM
jgi:hypothetical protein